MSEAFKLRQVLVNDEATFGELINATGSLTWEKNIPVREASVELIHEREPDGAMQARLAVEAYGHKGTRRARLTIRSYWMGHIADPTGALTETWQQQLLGDGMGGNSVAQVGGTLTGSPSVISLPFTGATLVRGAVIRVGTKGDLRADGQAAVLGSAVTTPAGLLTALPAAPIAGDLIRACMVAHHSEGAALVSKRFCVMHATTGAQFVLFGAKLARARWVTPIGGKPEIEQVWECAYWETVARTFPDSLARQSHDCAPISGGSFFMQAVGTTTRALKNVAELEVMVEMGLEPVRAIGGAGQFQDIVEWARTGYDVSFRIRVPWETAFQTLWDAENPSQNPQHFLATLSAGNGRSVGFYCPQAFPHLSRPSAVVNVNEQNYVDVAFRCTEGPDTTSELSRSAIRFFAS